MFNKEKLVEVLNRIEGYKTRLKELHWSSPSHSFHIIIDEYSGEIAEFEDALAENSIALLDFVYPGDLNPVLPSDDDFESLLCSVRATLSGLKEDCEDMCWSGIVNLIDDFWTTTNRYVYLAKISSHQAKLS